MNKGEGNFVDGDFAVNAVGVAPPRSFILDASVLDYQEEHRITRDDVKLNRVEFVFPDGLNSVDLFEECRAINKTDDFDTMYDLTMQMLEGKPVIINIKNFDGSKTELCSFQVVDRYQNLRGVDAIDSYPCLVTWLTEFIGAHLLKKYPLPTQQQQQQQQPQPQAAETTSGKKTD
jgi:hypothetical protein